MSTPPSGEQYDLAFGDDRAVIVQVGGGIRSYSQGGRDVLQPYPASAMCDGAHGAPLIPWPNRLADGRYRFDGVDYQVALTEPDKRNAIHGFLRWRTWEPREQADDRLTMTTRLHPLQGYPFALDVQVDYALAGDGLTVRTTATNIGDTACPYGCGQHPYLSPGGGLIDDCELEFGAGTRILTTADRQLPTGTHTVAGTPFDFSSPSRLGDLEIDHAFTDLARDTDGRAWVRLHGTDGRTAQLWVDGTYPLIELYTADTLAPVRQRRGLGTEPMTCPPNALATGKHVIRLQPGESTTNTWGAQLIDRAAADPAG
jgi:aldose 1-epimerase